MSVPMAKLNLAAMIAAVHEAAETEARRRAWWGYPADQPSTRHVADLRAAQAVLEGLADREWLGRAVFSAAYDGESSCGGRLRAADALRAALLARAGGGNG